MKLPPALRSRNYRLYFCGQGLSVLGTWMQRVAMHWLVYRLSGSELLLGLTGFFSHVPILLLAPFGGLLADRFDRRTLLIWTQALAMLQAFALAALTYLGQVEVWHVLLMAAALGIINAFDTPARQSLAVELLDDRRDLPNAIALNSLVNNSGRLIGPSIAGVALTLLTEGACFLINGLSYLSVLVALFMIRIRRDPAAAPRRFARHGIRDGMRLAWRSAPIRTTLAVVAIVSFLVTPYTTMMPAFVDRVLGGGAHTMGFMLSAAGVGAVLGTAYLAWRPSIAGLWRIMAIGACAAGAGLALFALSPWPWVSAPLIAAVGFGVIVMAASANTILQTVVADEMRGRIVSLYTMAFMGFAPLGTLAVGALAEAIGVQAAFVIGGLLAVVVAVVFSGRIGALRDTLQRTQPQLTLP